MRIGYACLALGVPNTKIRAVALARADVHRLLDIMDSNLAALANLLAYNRDAGIRLFRMSSDIIPFGSGGANRLPWDSIYKERLAGMGRLALAEGMRLSMHPGQYTVLNSPRAEVRDAAVEDLAYHGRFMDAMGLPAAHKIILHGGGGYGDKRGAAEAFCRNFALLPESVRTRLVLENDERIFNIRDILDMAGRIGVPVVFDVLHHRVNPPEEPRKDAEWIRLAGETWKIDDGPQKIHYSQQDAGKKPGAHSATIDLEAFLGFAAGLEGLAPDIMLEVKDKNLSAVKCINGLDRPGAIRRLEEEWSRYKYNVLEHDPAAYRAIRQLLKDKTGYPVLEFYRILDKAMASPVTPGHAANGADHVWGYFKDRADGNERKQYLSLSRGLAEGRRSPRAVKGLLAKLAEKYGDDYLAHSYYFTLD